MKLCFVDESCSSDGVYSKVDPEWVYDCHTLKHDLIATFHRSFVRLFDDNLLCNHEIQWNDQLPVNVMGLMSSGVPSNHESNEETGFICGF